MEFSIKSGSPEKQRVASVVVGVFDSRKLSEAGKAIDEAAGGYLSEIIRRGDMEGKLGTTLLLHHVPNTLCDRVLLVGLGKEREFREKQYREAMRAAVKTLNDTGSMEAAVYLSEIPVKRRDVVWSIEQAVVAAREALYRFDQQLELIRLVAQFLDAHGGRGGIENTHDDLLAIQGRQRRNPEIHRLVARQDQLHAAVLGHPLF